MLKKKFIILDSCSHETSEQLCSILESRIHCDIELIEAGQDLNLDTSGQPDLYFVVRDEVCGNGSGGIDRFPGVPGVVVLCTEGAGTQVDDSSMGEADDFIMTPLREPEIVYRIMRLIGKVSDEEKELAKKNFLQEYGFSQFIGQDPVFLETISMIPQVADCDATILLAGETGVGKELCARAIHYLSKRSNQPFIPVNCGAIPTNLIENELFGHRKGSYTDAQSNHNGIISESEGGTLFLDEIDGLPLEAQSKLLRLLQDKTYRPIGQSTDMQANIRVIAATNAELRQQMPQNQFREDLFYRFTITLKLPGLRERSSDIPLLANHFLRKYLNEYERGHKSLSSAALQKLMLHSWPGNIRELENIIQQAVVLTSNSVIAAENINIPTDSKNASTKELSYNQAKKIATEKFEKDYVTRLLAAHQGNITRAAKEAQKDRGDFTRLVQRLSLDRKSFRPNSKPSS